MVFKGILKKLWKKKMLVSALILLLGFLIFLAINFYIPKVSSSKIFEEIDDVPEAQTALILGAKVYSDGTLSDVLADRTIKGIELYKNGKVSKILVSGDHGRTEYDEVNAIKEYLLSNGVLGDDIFLDHAGFDTYDSLYRAREIFEVESLVIVTQEFHLPRAVYIGNALNIETYGYVADRQSYLADSRNRMRESLARIKAFGNVTFKSKPKFLGDAIPITGDSSLSWD